MDFKQFKEAYFGEYKDIDETIIKFLLKPTNATLVKPRHVKGMTTNLMIYLLWKICFDTKQLNYLVVCYEYHAAKHFIKQLKILSENLSYKLYNKVTHESSCEFGIDGRTIFAMGCGSDAATGRVFAEIHLEEYIYWHSDKFMVENLPNFENSLIKGHYSPESLKTYSDTLTDKFGFEKMEVSN